MECLANCETWRNAVDVQRVFVDHMKDLNFYHNYYDS